MYLQSIPILNELNVISVFIRLLMAVVFGGIIGIDRGRKRRPAGLRTHMLVCLGSALVMITNQFIVNNYQVADPARLGAQVISGIGFLGAGTIIVTRHQQVIGLTTAAGLWASACMGLAIGIGFYEGAILACLFILFIMMIMHRLDNRVLSNSRLMEIYVEMEEDTPLSVFLSYMSNHSIQINYIEIVKARDGIAGGMAGGTAALVTVRLPKRFEHAEVLMGLHRVKGVAFIEEV